MSAIPRRRLSELFTLYKIEERICDVFVEGPSDRVLVAKGLDGHLPFGSTIWPVGDVEIDIGKIDGQGGARSRVLAIAKAADSGGFKRLTCVIDRDLDEMAISSRDEALHVTYFTSLDFHAARIGSLSKIIEDAYLLSFEVNDIAQCVLATKFLYAVRHFGEKKSVPSGFPQFKKTFQYYGGEIYIDVKDFLVRMDSKNATGDFWFKSQNEIEQTISSLTMPHENCVNFHDLEATIGWLMHEKHSVKQQSLDFDWLGKLVRAQQSMPEDAFFEALRDRAASLAA